MKRDSSNHNNCSRSRSSRSALGFLCVVGVAGLLYVELLGQVSRMNELTEALSFALPTTTTTSSPPELKDNLARVPADGVWNDLLLEGEALMKNRKQHPPLVAMEVGMHRPQQCLQAAKLGLEVYCFEPSPTSFEKIETRVAQVRVEHNHTDLAKRLHIYNMAAGRTNGTVPFLSRGSTGDHVGDFDMWQMKAPEKQGSSPTPLHGGSIVEVPVVRLDDIVESLPDGQGVFLLKVDTQGYEPEVLAGLERSIAAHKVQHILFEYWPRGIDLIAGTPNQCSAAQLLHMLHRAGYTLYALKLWSHPKAPLNQQHKFQRMKQLYQDRPLNNFDTNCQWYFSIEDLYPSDDYKMGYWSDILAVAPARNVEEILRVSKTGQEMK